MRATPTRQRSGSRWPSRSSDGEAAEDWLDLERPSSDAAASLDTDIDNVFPDTPSMDLGGGPSDSGWASLTQRTHNLDLGDSSLEDYISNERSLREHLQLQLPLALKDPADRIVGQYLIDLIDDAGYLPADLQELAEKLGATLGMVERVLAIVQTFEPSGVFARSLGECLALQLKEQNRYDPMIGALLDNLHLLAAHNMTGLRKAVGCDMTELSEMIDEIKQLNPKPGLVFGSAPVQTVVPDILVRPAADQSWLIELNADTLPRVLVNRSYLTTVSSGAQSEKDKTYLVDCLQTANWLVKSLDQRARTILRVAEEIVRQQDGFFAHGIQHLRPLNLKTVADAISMHEFDRVTRDVEQVHVHHARAV